MAQSNPLVTEVEVEHTESFHAIDNSDDLDPPPSRFVYMHIK